MDLEFVLADEDGPMLQLKERYPGAEIVRLTKPAVIKGMGLLPARTLLVMRNGKVVGGAFPAGSVEAPVN